MFSGIRKAWNNYQDRKVAKKYEPKVQKEKNNGLAFANKKPIIILAIIFSLVIVSIVGAVCFKSSKTSSNNKKKNATSVSKALESEETEEFETSMEESNTLPVYTDVPTKKHKKKHKDKDDEDIEDVNNDIDIYDSGSDINNYSPVNVNSGSNSKPKKNSISKPKRKANNKVPTQYEHNSVLGGSKISLIKNSLRGSINGVSNSNMRNLAIYMANNGTSSCSAALKNLCGYTTLKAGCKKAIVKIPSNSKDDVTNATVKICNKLSGSYGKFGFGVAARFSGNKYNITVVVCYLK